MKKFEYQRSVRFSESVKESLQEICDAFRMNESDYIRTSVQRCIVNDMQKQGLEPKFKFIIV
jgi:predicted DNA-binding protein